MIDLEQLRQFLIEADQEVGYGSGNESAWVKEFDGATVITYQGEEWKYQDKFYGGEPYSGQTTVSFNGRVVWTMEYRGLVIPSVENIKEIYTFLQEALSARDEEFPIRGPMEYTRDRFVYKNIRQGSVSDFSGEEVIIDRGREIYKAKYMGGLVDQREE